MENSGRSLVAGDTISATSADEMKAQVGPGTELAASFVSATTSRTLPEDTAPSQAVDILHNEPTSQQEKRSVEHEKIAWTFVRTFTPS